jgi:hypothetical protein
MLTAASAYVLMHQRHPHWIDAVNTIMNELEPQTVHSRGSIDDGVSKAQSSALDAIRVLTVGTDVSAQDVNRVKRIIQENHVLTTITQDVGMHLFHPVQLYLAKTKDDYQSALSQQGMSVAEAKRFSHDTGGFTIGSVVIIPLYQNATEADLTNTIAHELTHAVLNENVQNVPSWMNEGMAVHDGMQMQSLVEDAVSYDGFAKRMAESVLDAVRRKELLPLVSDETSVLSGRADYDIELQDWLAVSYLIQKFGIGAIHKYFSNVKQGELPNIAFANAFGISLARFNREFTDQLRHAANSPDAGVSLRFQCPSGFKGKLMFLQHDVTEWRSVDVGGGAQSFYLKPDGTIQGHPGLATVQDAGSPDGTTLYINVEPSRPYYRNGKRVVDCGFAIDYHNGLYGFVNAWETYSDGTTNYIHRPSVVGVTMTNLTQPQSGSPVLSWIHYR